MTYLRALSRFRARAVVSLLTVALAGGGVAAPALAAAGPSLRPSITTTAPTRPQAASGWLARQMVNGSHFVTVFDGTTYPAQGETIDALLAFAATKTANGYGSAAIRWLAGSSVLDNYIGAGTESYAGATAKLALAAEVRGDNPARFGKVNLIARLAKLLTKSGRYSDHSKYGDFSNAFSQSLAIIALSRHGGAPAKAVAFLLSTACKNGGFPLDFGEKTCVSDPDSTAMAAQALLATCHRAAADRGLRWLAHIQKSNGGIVASGGTTPNANTTGLAGEAFAAAGWLVPARRAAGFLRSLQRGCSAPAGQRGALDYDASGFAESTAVDATAQGILGLADVSLAKLTARGASTAAPRLAC
jgi:hypothetical protein